MKRFLLALALVLALCPSFAMAQCNGVFPPNTVCGTVAGGIPGQVPASSLAGGPGGSPGQIQYNNAGTLGGFTASGDATINTSTGVVTLNTVATSKGGTGASNSTNSANDVLASNGANGNFVHTALMTLLNAICTATPGPCTQFFGYTNVKWFGAVGDGSTDDTTAIQGTVTFLINNYGAGIVYFPPSSTVYCTFTGITNTTAGPFGTGDIKFLGAGVRASALDVCGHNVVTLTIGLQFGSVENMAIYGYGMHATDTFNVTHASTVLLTSGASYVQLKQLLVQGGSFPLDVECSGCRINQVTAQYAYGDASGIRAANARVINSGQYWSQVSLDQIAPTTPVPTFPTTVSSWAATTAYTKGQVINVACNSVTWFVQITTTGTSGGSQPACKNYFGIVTDGTAAWTLVGPNPGYAMQVDTGANEVMVSDTDMTGFFASSCFGMTNSFAGTAPTNVWLHNVTPGGCYAGGVDLKAGSDFRWEGADFQGCILSGCSGLFVESTFGTNVSISGVLMHNGFSIGVLTAASKTGMSFMNNFILSATTNAFSFGATNDVVVGIGNVCVGTGKGGSALGANSFFPSGASGNPQC